MVSDYMFSRGSFFPLHVLLRLNLTSANKAIISYLHSFYVVNVIFAIKSFFVGYNIAIKAKQQRIIIICHFMGVGTNYQNISIILNLECCQIKINTNIIKRYFILFCNQLSFTEHISVKQIMPSGQINFVDVIKKIVYRTKNKSRCFHTFVTLSPNKTL